MQERKIHTGSSIPEPKYITYDNSIQAMQNRFSGLIANRVTTVALNRLEKTIKFFEVIK